MEMETWYVLEDGTAANPNECRVENGRLRHKNGFVAMRGDAYSSRGVDVTGAKNSANREVTSDKQKKTYKTRES